MNKKIYTPTFVRESKEAIVEIDNVLSIVEQEINNLAAIKNKYAKGRSETLNEVSKTTVSDYDDNVERMWGHLADLYALKNELLRTLDEIQ